MYNVFWYCGTYNAEEVVNEEIVALNIPLVLKVELF